MIRSDPQAQSTGTGNGRTSQEVKMPDYYREENAAAARARSGLDGGGNNTPAPAADLTMKGRFARYTSAFLSLMLPLLSTRYLWIALEDLNPFDVLKKKPPVSDTGAFRYISRNIKALGMGLTVGGILSFYTKRTHDDIRTIYAEAVGYELGKKPEDVGWRDIYFKSQNPALAATRHDFFTRSLGRFASAASFFVPWHLLRKKIEGQKPGREWTTNLDAGVGVMGTYLSLDGFLRNQTFFEALQTMVDNCINHVDGNISGIIKPGHIQSLLLLHRKRQVANYMWPSLGSKEAENETALATRVADFANQTYNNAPNTEHAHFTIGKFTYLAGFGLLDKFPQSLAFVELANKSSDMKEVKAAAAAIKKGQDPRAVFAACGIDMDNPIKKEVQPAVQTTGNFVDMARPKAKIVAARTHQDFANVVDAQLTHHP